MTSVGGRGLSRAFSTSSRNVSSDKCASGLSETLWAMSSCCGDLPKPRSSSISMAFSLLAAPAGPYVA